MNQLLRIWAAIGFLVVACPLYAGQAEPAEQEAEEAPAEQAEDDNLTGNYLSGQFARSTGDTDAAIRYLRRVHKADPQNYGIGSQLLGLLLMQGEMKEAVAVAKTLQSSEEKDPIASMLLALQAIRDNELEQASRILDEGFNADNGQLWLPLVNGWLDAAQRKLLKPLTMDDLAVAVGRAAPLVNYHLALINGFGGFTEAAAMNFSNAVEDARQPPMRVMAVLLDFYEKNNQPVLLKPLVTTYREANPTRAADEQRPQINTLQDGVAEVLFTIGSIMQAAGATQDAALYLQLTLYMQPKLAEASLALGESYATLKQFTRANEVYGRIPRESRLRAKADLQTAVNLDRMNKTKEAYALLEKLAVENPESIEPFVAKAELLRTHKRYGEAIGAYSEAMERAPQLGPRLWPILFARAICYEREGKWPLAEQDLQKALELKPDQPDVLNYLAYGWLSRNEHIPQARDMLEKAVQVRPNDPQIVDSMGWAYFLLGDYDKATEYLERAVGLLPSDATVNDHLGDAYWLAGRKTEARFQWQRSLIYSPEPDAAEETRRKLKDGLSAPASAAEHVPEQAKAE